MARVRALLWRVESRLSLASSCDAVYRRCAGLVRSESGMENGANIGVQTTILYVFHGIVLTRARSGQSSQFFSIFEV